MNRKWKKIIFFALILSIQTTPLNSIAVDKPSGLGVFQIVVVPVNTKYGDSSANKINSKAIVSNVSKLFKEMTASKISFELKDVVSPIFAEEKPPNDILFELKTNTAGLKISSVPDPGYAGVILIYVMENPGDSSARGGSGPDVGAFTGALYINNLEIWNNPVLRVFETVIAHELGHALGLQHANSATCNLTIGASSCITKEYGDPTDIMGSGGTSFSAFNLDRLGVLNPSEKIDVKESGEFKVSPLCSGEYTKPKILYLPIYEEVEGQTPRVYEIEYRPNPLRGIETKCQDLMLPDPLRGIGTGFDGVQVRFLAQSYSNSTLWPTLQPLSPTVGDWDGHSALLQNKSNLTYAFQPNQSITLSDGSVISVKAIDPILGADVVITRPKPVGLPKIKYAEFGWIYPPLTRYSYSSLGLSVSVPKKSNVKINWPSIMSFNNVISSSRPISKVKLEVNGRIVDTGSLITRNAGDPILFFTPRTIGTFKVRLIVTDEAGMTSATPISIMKSSFYVPYKSKNK
jgi:hypothetical protein